MAHILQTIHSLGHSRGMRSQNGTSQNGNVTKRFVLQKGRVTKRYVLQNGTCYTTVRITKRYSYKTVCVTKQYVTKRYILQNVTFFLLYYECNIPRISWPFVLT
jgi:hypothetical protein